MQTTLGGVLRQQLRPQTRIPVLSPPDPRRLKRLRFESDLPARLQDRAILAQALASLDQAARVPKENWSRSPADVRDVVEVKNVLFLSHCDFMGNSALHVYSIASELHRRGLTPIVAVPDNVESVEVLGWPAFRVLSYEDARDGNFGFIDGSGPDLIHAFSTREIVRRLTIDLVRAHGCPYVVHLEDDDEAILSAVLGGIPVDRLRRLPLPILDRVVGPSQSHPLRMRRFLSGAAGITAVVERLLEFAPRGVPAQTIGAGFDEAVLTPQISRADVRRELQLNPDDLAVLYTGAVHAANVEDVRSLFNAVALLRSEGSPVVLVKTGWDAAGTARLPKLGSGIRDLGWVQRRAIPELLAAADILVQPGSPGHFNDRRLPSKLPEYLASGKPVVLPCANIGLELRNGVDALVLERGDTDEIAAAIRRLATSPDERRRLGDEGRAFALKHLRWEQTVDDVQVLYSKVDPRPTIAADRLDEIDPPVKVVAVIPEYPTDADCRETRAHGVFGFCLAPAAGAKEPSVPFCFQIDDTDHVVEFADALAAGSYIEVAGKPLLIVARNAAAGEVRPLLGRVAGEPVHLALVADDERSDADAVVEPAPSAQPPDMLARLDGPLHAGSWYRSITAPGTASELPDYARWLRKLVLQTLVRGGVQEPLLFVHVDARVWSRPAERSAWLTATRAGIADGIRQFYESQDLVLQSDELDAILRLA